MTGPTRTLRFTALLTEQGWIEPAFVTLDAEGATLAISQQNLRDDHPTESIDAYVVPGFCNAHSHAFQFAMAGLAEHLPLGSASDDFWSWREAMYTLANKLTPEQMEHVAAMVYAEMLRHGITAVAEFHYVHHDTNGRPFNNLAEMSISLASAAETAGIHLSLLPVFYQKGGFGQAPLPQQRRFVSQTSDDYLKLLDACRTALSGKRDRLVGSAVHSLRAVCADDALRVFKSPLDGPAHLHIAEQQKEVDDCLAKLGQRPVAWLLDNIDVDARFCLVHATHMNSEETERLAHSGAVSVICPSTEGNLGDGFFPLADYAAKQGVYAIGSDSHITLSPLEDLRWLDYGMRLRHQRRNVLCQTGGDDSGHLIFDATLRGGRKALGLNSTAYFPQGSSFDAVLIDPEHPVIAGKPAARRLSAFVYGGDASCISGVLRRGSWIVKNRQHIRYEEIRQAFARTVKDLWS